MTCVRADGRLTLAKLVELPAGIVIVSGVVAAKTTSSVTVRGTTCLVPASRTKPVLGVPTIVRDLEVGGVVTMACTQVGGQLTLKAVAER
jgi:hypothetical protein